MKEMASRLAGRKWDETTGSLDFSCREILFSLPPDAVEEGSFHVTGPNGELTEGFVSCSGGRMECLTAWFSGILDEIAYRFDSSELKEGDSDRGSFCILSNQGEYEIPYEVTVAARQVPSSLGDVKNLFHFTNLARSNWQEAVTLFYSASFAGILESGEPQLRRVYEGLSQNPGNSQNVEEFLLYIHKKERIEYLTDRAEIVLTDVMEKAQTELTVTRNGWGYTRLRVETEGDFLSASKTLITGQDFLDNICHITLYLDRDRLHAGRNFGSVKLIHPYGEILVPVRMECRLNRKGQSNYRHEQKQLLLQLTEAYLDFRMKKTNTAKWLAATRQIVDRMNAMDDKDPAVRLFQAHILITEERYKEGRWILDHVQLLLKEEAPALHCYYLYLTSLINRSRDYAAEVTRQVEDIFRFYNHDWRIAWLLLYLSEEMNRSVTKKWLFLEEQFTRRCTSPVMYGEAVNLMNANPTLLMKLGNFELQCLYFAVRRGVLSTELAGHFYYLAGREKAFREPLLKILYLCYEKKPDPACLQAICTLLIKGNRAGSAYFRYYRDAVEKELRITRLYEYYMMSLDLSKEENIPRMVLMYFAYQSNLDPELNAYLYCYLMKHREEYPELSLAYAPQIERFVLKELYQGHMNRHLAYLYRTVLTGELLTPDNCNALAPLLFLYEVASRLPQMKRAVILHESVQEEEVYPVEEGRAYVPFYGKEDVLLLEDDDFNRYAAGSDYELKKLMFPRQVLEQAADRMGDQLGLDLYLCHDLQNGKITAGNASRFRFLTQSEELEPAVRRAVRMRLIQFYYDQDMVYELDGFLNRLEYDGVEDRERPELIRFLVLRSMYEKAYQWVKRMGPEAVDAKILVRLCSRVLEKRAGEEDPDLLRIAFSAFDRGKYDTGLLEYLVRFYEGSTGNMLRIWNAAESFVLDTYSICSRLLVQSLYTGGSLGEAAAAIFKTYVSGGARMEIERAFLDHCAHAYLLKDEPLPEYVLQDMLRCYKRRETLGTGCGLALLQYYADRGKEEEEVRQMLILCARQLLQAGIQMPFFARYASLLPEMEAFADRTVISFRGDPRKGAVIHYRTGGAEEAFEKEEMRNMYGGIFVRSFVLFCGEKLEYFITAAEDETETPLASGLREMTVITGSDAGAGEETQTRFAQLNGLIQAVEMGEKERAARLLAEYRHTEFLVERLFRPV